MAALSLIACEVIGSPSPRMAITRHSQIVTPNWSW